MTSREEGRPPGEGRPISNSTTTTGNDSAPVALDMPQMSITVPGHPLAPAEADLRFTVNTIEREGSHWWLKTVAGQAQRQFLVRMGWWAS